MFQHYTVHTYSISPLHTILLIFCENGHRLVNYLVFFKLIFIYVHPRKHYDLVNIVGTILSLSKYLITFDVH